MILPVRKETIVLSYRSDEVAERLRYVTAKRKKGLAAERPVKFVGKIENNGFTISRYLTRPENFMPMIQGVMEDVSQGCLLSLRYTLQFSSRMFVVFWTITALLFALFLWFYESNLNLAIIALTALVLNIVITHINFHRHYKRTRKVLMDVLNA